MYVAPQERPFDSLALALPMQTGNPTKGEIAPDPTGLLSALTPSDGISQLLQPVSGASGAFGSLTSALGGGLQPILNALAQMLQQLAAMLTGGTTPSGPIGTAEQQFATATASSTGDPHLAFTATDETGNANNAKWDSMSDHHDLLDSDSFSGGYRVATKATQPNANGVTYNQRAAVITNNGQTRVSLDAAGNASIFNNGQRTSIADGQSLNLGNGETVARANDGSLTISDDDGYGGTITTTLRDNGQGVDVNAQASDVDLGGDLVSGPSATSVPPGGIAPQHVPLQYRPVPAPGWRHLEHRPHNITSTGDLGDLEAANTDLEF